ncbi:MAG: DUF4412 domain-containing protein [Flavobacteriaceae bacterium]|nr:DUF4412 domain-containing protein [Flavobacteriaceae bacterium]
MKTITIKKPNNYLLTSLIFLVATWSNYAQVWVITEANNNTTYIGKEWLKSIEYDEDRVSTSIYNLSEDKMMLIDENQNIYAKGSSTDFCNAIRSFSDEMNKNIPVSQQKMIQDLIKAEKAKVLPKITISKSSGEKIAGYKTIKYSIFMNGGLYEEIWITNDSALSSIMIAYRKILKESSKITKCMVPDEAFLRSTLEFAEEYKEVEMAGVTLKSINYEDYESNIQTEVVSLTNELIPASEFDVPEGCKLVSFKEFLRSTSGM